MNNSFFYEQMKKCVEEFYNIYNLDDYISKSKYESFLDKYKDIFAMIGKYDDKENELYKKMIIIAQNGYDIIYSKNISYINKHLTVDKEYFDNLFLDIDSKILLDEEQRKAILCDEDYSLVIAGAGSGKTTTMAAKVKYLIEKKHVNPKEIILLSFTNKATEELNGILNDKFHLNVDVLTFHKLGMKFIRNMLKEKPKIISESYMYTVLSEYFTDYVFKDKEKLKKYMILFSKQLFLDDEVFDFETYDEYYNNYAKVKYELCKDNLNDEINNRVYKRIKYLKTINGELVDSEAEVKIANFLYKNGISYSVGGSIYGTYPFKLSDGRSYKPDFTVHDGGNDIYIEYYGLAKCNLDGSIESTYKNYKEDIIKKRNTHRIHHTEYIELFGRYEDGRFYLPVLSLELIKKNIIKKKKSDAEIFMRLLETSKSNKYMNLIKLMIVFIQLFKELGYDYNDFEVLKKEADTEDIKEQLDLLKEVYVYYQDKIHTAVNDTVCFDFQDMINYAYAKMEELKSNNEFNYKYVIIDEYQDISKQRYNFAKRLSDLFKAKIVAVGDDYQTIFSFSGSDIELFTKFYENVGYASIMEITKTYRNSQELIDVAGEFIQKNKFQLYKRLVSDKHLYKPVELVEYEYSKDSNKLPEMLNNLLIELYSKNSHSKVLLLCRFKSEIYSLIDSKLFYIANKKEGKIICKKCPNLSIDIMTIHNSKGLGYDQVILLNALNIHMGFPSQIEDETIIKYIKGTNNLDENIIEYPEERRLFYVAMTRTKNKLYIMIPNKYEYKSDFIKEIENDKNVMIRYYRSDLNEKIPK